MSGAPDMTEHTARGAPLRVLLALLCAGLLVACTWRSTAPPKPRNRSSSELSPTSPGSATPGAGTVARRYRDGFAIWPEDTYEAAVEASAAPHPAAWRRDANGTAMRFASDVLGWSGISTEMLHGGDDGTRVAVTQRRAGEELELSLREEPPGWWSVVNALPHGEYFPTMTVRGEHVSLGVELEGGAVAAEVTVGYGGRDRTVTKSSPGKVDFDLGFRPSTSGHFLVLYRDAGGETISALGSTLRAGDFAAS